MKRGKLIKNIILVILFSFIISACSNASNPSVETVDVREESIPDYIVLGTFDDAQIEAIVKYDDGSSETVILKTSFLDDDDKKLLDTIGEHELEFLIKGVSTKLKVKVVESANRYEVNFYDGHSVLISSQVVHEGEDATSPEANDVKIEGYSFIGWDKEFVNVREDLDVYAIYSSNNQVQNVNELSNKLLLKASDMVKNDLNVIHMDAGSDKVTQETNYYIDNKLDNVVKKVTDTNGNYYHNRLVKEMSSNGKLTYYSEDYNENNSWRYKTEIEEEDFYQYELYSTIKNIVIKATDVQVSANLSKNQVYYKFTGSVYNNSSSMRVGHKYEIEFNNDQIVSIKCYSVFQTSSLSQASVEYLYTRYYHTNVAETEKIIFPVIVLSGDIASKFVKGSITNSDTVIETEHFVVNLEPNIYVPGYFQEHLEIIYDSIETVTGLKFYNAYYNDGKIIINVEKGSTDNYPESETGGCGYAISKSATICVSSSTMLLGNSYTITHELSHILMYSQTFWSYSKVFVEGFAEYTSYKTIKYLEKTNMTVAKTLIDTRDHITNMFMTGDIYSKTIKYWISHPDNAYDIAGNGPYAVGFRYMAYLDDTFGNHVKWLKYYEKKDPYYTNYYRNQTIDLNEQYAAMTTSYGSDVFDNFYGWLRENEDMFSDPWGMKTPAYDLRSLEYAYIYPYFYSNVNVTKIAEFYKFSYTNLYISIDEARNYLANYKGKDVSNLRLKLEKAVMVELYDSNNRLLEVRVDKEFSLVGVCYIKLVGMGELGYYGVHGLEIVF